MCSRLASNSLLAKNGLNTPSPVLRFWAYINMLVSFSLGFFGHVIWEEEISIEKKKSARSNWPVDKSVGAFP